MMNSKERVLAAINHEEPDRVPLAYSGNKEITEKLMRHFNIPVSDPESRDALTDALNCDIKGVGAPYCGPKLHDDIPGLSVDYWGVRRKWTEHSAGGYWDYCDWPLKDATLEEIEAWPMPSPDDFDYSVISERCEKYRDKFMTAGIYGYGDTINTTGFLRTMEQVLIDLALDDEAGLRLIDRRQEIQLEVLARSLEAGKGKIDAVFLGEDLGTQKGPILSLEMFRKHIKPRIKRFADIAKTHNLPVLFHSCGSSSWAFDDLHEIGINVVDTLQPEAENMQPEYLKKRFGDRLAFKGCISTAGPLAYGTVKDVMENVKETLEIMMPGGGYILSPTHQIQSNSPMENVLAMYEIALTAGKY